jgi:hypothetical protein
LDVYLEVGVKRAFACAVDWPGWARAGRDENAALAALVEYGPRYRAAIGNPRGLKLLAATDALRVVERLEGNATTDFGVPGAIPTVDEEPTDDAELDRLLNLLRSAWAAFDAAAGAAHGHDLAPSGPRGGGRSLDKMRNHIAEAEAAYVRGLGGRADDRSAWPEVQKAFIVAAEARARGELPDAGPRGGRRWPARYAIRRSAWHALDHAWEIEDRVQRQA